MKKNTSGKSPNYGDTTRHSTNIAFWANISNSPLLSFAVIALSGFLVYSNSFDCSFQMDDVLSIVNNAAIKDLANISEIWQTDRSRFIAYLSFAINYYFSGFNVWSYHLVNLLIHIANAALVGWLARLVFLTPALKNSKVYSEKNQIAFFAALLFVVHPLATQSVTYIVQRMSSMVAFFYLLSVCTYIAGRVNNSKRVGSFAFYTISILAAIFALFTKQNAFTLPFSIITIEVTLFLLEKENLKIDKKTVLLVIAIVSIALGIFSSNYTLSIFEPVIPYDGTDHTITSSKYFLTQFSVILKYIQLLLVPVNQNLDYDYPLSHGLYEIRTFLSVIAIASIFYISFKNYKKHPIVTFSTLWFFITISVESSFIPIADLIFEHRTYLPSFGFFLLFSYSTFLLLRDKYSNYWSVVMLVIAATFGYLTYQRNKIWKSPMTMWTDVIAKSPNKARPVATLGDFYQEEGQFQKAIDNYKKAISLHPGFATGYLNLGTTYYKMQKYDEAYNAFSAAIKYNSTYTSAYFNRAVVLAVLGKYDNALIDYNKAIELDHAYKAAYHKRAECYIQLSRFSEAIEDCTKAIALDDKFTDGFFTRGTAYGHLKNWNNASVDFTMVVKLNPNWKMGWYNLGVSYMSMEKWQDGINAFSEDIKIAPTYFPNYINRGVCYANLKKWQQALESYEQALRIDPNNTNALSNKQVALREISK